MQLTVFTDRLNKALLLVSRVVSSKSQLPILGNVLLTAEKGSLFLSTTNLETAINTKISAVVEKEGKITVPVKQLVELTSLIKEEKINLILRDNIFFIEGKNIKNSLNTAPAADFPPILLKKGEISLVIKDKEFIKTVQQIAIAASYDESRPLLGGAKFILKKQAVQVAATDGYRLSVKEVAIFEQKFEGELIIPVKTLIEVVKIANEEKSKEIKIMILKEQNQAVFVFENTEIVSRLINGDFPNFQKIIPNSFTTKIVVDKSDFLNSVKMSAIFARESANIVKMKIEGKALILSSNAPSVGENVSSLEIEHEGEDIEVAFNYRFLLDFLNAIEEERVIFETNGSLNPGVFKGEKDKTFLHIIMPVRVQS